MRVGYVGLGDMGGALARRLQLTHPLVVHDLDARAVQSLTTAGATPGGSLPGLAERCDLILLCLPTSGHVRSAIFGPGGLAEAARPGTLVVDQSTGDPHATRSMAAELASRGIELIDAPVSGGARGAQAGTIAIMVGAGQEQFARVSPVLSAISPNVFHVGAVGDGHVIKLVNNVVSGTQRLLTFEALALAAKNGVDPSKALEVLMASGGKNAFMERSMPSLLQDGRLGAGFTLGLMYKDMRLACDLGANSGVPMFLGNVAREMYQICMAELGRDANVNGAAHMMDRLAGTQVLPRPTGPEPNLP